MEGFNSPSLQPKDPGRAFDPGLKEDPDISMELVDGTFYQASCDGTLVAIIADYPGLLSASRVSKAAAFGRRFLPYAMPYAQISYFYRDDHRNAAPSPWGLISKGHPG